MSDKRQADGEKFRQKYARAYGLPVEDVIVEYFENEEEEVQVYYSKDRVDHPVWTRYGVTPSGGVGK